MQIAIINNGVIERIGYYKDLFPETSFNSNGPSDEWLNDNNALRVNMYREYDQLTQKVVRCDPVIEGDWVYVVSVVNLTEEEIEFNKHVAMLTLREERNRLLSESDKTQLPDATQRFDQPAWAAYRQLLADFPSTIADARLPYEFPTPPEDIN